jgi:hypothetical protein
MSAQTETAMIQATGLGRPCLTFISQYMYAPTMPTAP